MDATPYKLVKTALHLETWQVEQLKRIKRQEGLPQSAQVRIAITEYLHNKGYREPEEPV